MSPIGGITLRYHRAYVIIPCAATPCAEFAFCLALGCTLFRLSLQKVRVEIMQISNAGHRNARFPINTQAHFMYKFALQ